MKRLLTIILLVLISIGLLASETTRHSKNSDSMDRQRSKSYRNNASRNDTRTVPSWQISTAPLTLLNSLSYYDYMIGGYNDLPIGITPQTQGYFLTYQGKSTPTGNRRVYYAYITEDGNPEVRSLITQDNYWEGYPSVAVDHLSGKPLYAWHYGLTEADPVYDVRFSYDTFFDNQAGLMNTPVKVVDNLVTDTLFTNPPVITTDNEYIYPSVKVGPSPIAGMSRVYILTRNATNHVLGVTEPSENVRIDYADFNADMLEMGAVLVWHHTSIPLLDAWNSATDGTFRRPHYAFTVGNDGRIYYVGYHTAEYVASGNQIEEPDMDVFVCDNYGQGTWQRYSAYSTVPSWNPPTNNGSGPGYFAHNGIPYSNSEIFWKIAYSEHINAEIDNNNIIHCPATWYLNSADSLYADFNTIKEITFNANSNQFSIREIYPIAGTSTDEVLWQPWDTDGNVSVDFYQADGNPSMFTDWNLPYWSASMDEDELMKKYNNCKMTKPNTQGWMACVWQNSWRAKEYSQNGTVDYQQYATVPEIYISVSSDFGLNWSEPIIINSVDTPQFTGIRPMWVYPASEIAFADNISGNLALMFYHDNTWGSSANNGIGPNDGGYVKFMIINIIFHEDMPAHVSGHIRDASTHQPISNALISADDYTCNSNIDGSYDFYLEFWPSHINVSVTAPGYHSQTISNVAITNLHDTTLDFNLNSYQYINVNGTVKSSMLFNAIENATITLHGLANYTTTTNENGTFTIPNVIANQTYQYTVTKAGYSTASGSVSVLLTDFNMGNIILAEFILPPTNVTLNLISNSNIALVQWDSPSSQSSKAKSNDVNNGVLLNRIRNNRAQSGYKVWRLLSGQESSFPSWTQVDSVPAFQMSIQDNAWSSLPSGMYKYAVQTIYSSHFYSDPVFSNELEKPVVNIDETDNLPIDKLLGCYPNPFTNSTQFTFSLKASSPVEIRIFNIQGQLVKTIAPNQGTKGMNSIIWDATGKDGQRVPSGIYFCKLKANGKESIRKVMLLK